MPERRQKRSLDPETEGETKPPCPPKSKMRVENATKNAQMLAESRAAVAMAFKRTKAIRAMNAKLAREAWQLAKAMDKKKRRKAEKAMLDPEQIKYNNITRDLQELVPSGVRGTVVSPDIQLAAIHMVHTLWTKEGAPADGSGQTPASSLEERFRRVSKALSVSDSFVKKAYNHFCAHRKLAERTYRQPHKPDPAVVQVVQETITNFIMGGDKTPVVVHGLARAVLEKVGVEVTEAKLAIIAKNLGFRYHNKLRPAADPAKVDHRSLCAIWHRLIYIAKLERILQEIKDGKAELGWQDESFAHLTLAVEASWAGLDGRVVGLPPTKGRLLSISHVITRKGLLIGYDVKGARLEPPINNFQRAATAELILSPSAANADHHTYNGLTFLDWLTNRFYPAAEAAFPECFGPNATKVFYLHLDNAPSHHSPGPDTVDFTDWSKEKIVDYLLSQGITSLEYWMLEANGKESKHRIVINEELKRRSTDPKKQVDRLKMAATQWITKNYPERTRCAAEKFAADKGFVILWGAPNEPEWNPIEMVWSVMKAYVAILYREGRTQAELLQQLREALYTTAHAAPGKVKNKGGGYVPDEPDGTCTSAKALINHCMGKMNEWIDAHKVLLTYEDPVTKQSVPWIQGKVGEGLIIAPDLLDLAKTLTTRRCIAHFIKKRVDHDLPKLATGGREPDADADVPVTFPVEQDPELMAEGGAAAV